MIREIIKDVFLLSQKAEEATIADKNIANDLIDTLEANKERCVGMAANMIGENKAIIYISTGPIKILMFNPAITKKKGLYKTKEGCLSLTGERECDRYDEIEIDYLDSDFKPRHMAYKGFIAEIIQHEIDHLDGKII